MQDGTPITPRECRPCQHAARRFRWWRDGHSSAASADLLMSIQRC